MHSPAPASIQKNDKKQKILKITTPEVLNKNIEANVVIIYGDVSGNIKADNVVCIKGNISGNIDAEKVLMPPGVRDAKTDYRRHHPNCNYCKFYEVHRFASWSMFPLTYSCGITKKSLKKDNKIKARLCKYYEPGEN